MLLFRTDSLLAHNDTTLLAHMDTTLLAHIDTMLLAASPHWDFNFSACILLVCWFSIRLLFPFSVIS